MRRYFEFVLSHRALVCLVLLLISALASASLSRVILGSSLQKLFFGDAPEYWEYHERISEFANDEVFFVGIEEADPLATEHLASLEAAVTRIEADLDIARVESVLSAQRIGGVDGWLEVQSYADAARENPEEREALVEELLEDPLYSGLIIAKDGQSHALIVEAVVNPDRNPEDRPDLVGEMVEILVEEGLDPVTIRTAGLPRLMTELLNQTYGTLQVIFPLTLVIMVSLVLGIFRRLAPVMVASCVSLLAVLWTTGFSTELDRHMSIMSTIIPPVVLVVAVSDVIHMWTAYLGELRAGRSKHEAILESATDVGRACLWTSATTFVGFVCLSLVPTPVFRLLGVVLGFGVATALILAMTLVPMVLSVLAEPELRPISEENWLDRTIRCLVDGCSRISTEHPWRVIGVFGLVWIWVGIGLSQFEIETRFNDRMDEDTLYSQDASWFADHYQGNQTMEVFIDAPEVEGLLDHERVARISAFEERVRALPAIDGIFSYTLLLEKVMEVMTGEARSPESREQIAQSLLLFEMGGGEGLDRMLSFERDSMRAAVRLNEEGIRETWRISQQIEQIGAEELGDMEVMATGLNALFGWWVDAILEGQKNGILLSVSLITLMMIIALRSFRAGLISMVPNLLPLLALGAVLGWTTDGVDSDALVIGMMAIGIGVDDTVHFMVRYRIEAGRCESRQQAVRRTFDFAGRAILITTLILSLGFLPFVYSDYISLWYWGSLLPLALVIALLADLLWVPALAQLGVFGFQKEVR